VNTYDTDRQLYSDVTSLKDGGFVVTWASNGQDGSGYGVYAQRFDSSGSAAGGEFQVNTYTIGHQGLIDNGIIHGPSIASLNGGGFVATWSSQDQDGSDYGTYGQIFDASGTKVGVEIPLNTATIRDQLYGDVTSLQDGGFVVTWISNDNSYGDYGNDVFAQRFNSDGAKNGIEFQVNTHYHHEVFVSATTLSNGNVAFAW
jgi:hypothetical protein